MLNRTSRNLLIVFILVLASVQVVRTDFFINIDYINTHLYGQGLALFPYQGRVLMVPILHWAGNSHAMQMAALRYQRILPIGSPLLEPVSPEKFASLLIGIVSLLAMVAVAAAYGWQRMRELWWLPASLTLFIAGITLDLHVEQNIWYPYDLPHAAFFGIGIVAALNRRWMMCALLFCCDVFTRETAIFLPPIVLPLFWLDGSQQRAELLHHRDWRAVLATPRARLTALAAASALLFWAAVQWLIHHQYPATRTETGTHFQRNFHELLLPHHWSQTLSAGGYLAVFIWLGRRHLLLPERLVLTASLLCLPIVLYFSIWTETRVWLEWSLPLGIAASIELVQVIRTNHLAQT